MPGSGQLRTPWCTACRCSTCTAWCWVCSGRCASETASCTPENQRRRPTRPPAARCTSVYRRCGPVSSVTRLPPRRFRARGCWCPAVPVFDKLVQLTGHAPVERYGATESLITLSTRADGERRPGWVGLPLAGIETRLVDDDGGLVAHDAETLGRR